MSYDCLQLDKGDRKVMHLLKHLRAYFSRICYLMKYIWNVQKVDAVLIDTPTHENLGDHAIVLAEQQLLENLDISYYELTANMIDRIEKLFGLFTPMNHLIVVPGGGFLGTLWPKEEYRFRRILKAFDKQKIIVFPQTITFDMDSKDGYEFFLDSYKIYHGCKDLTIFAREENSYAFMRKNMPDVCVELVPDIVTILNSEKSYINRTGILFCLRSDKEKVLSLDDEQYLETVVRAYYPNEIISHTDTELKYCVSVAERKDEVENKLAQFSKAKLVITDRLHGMVFAAITNTPCIAMGNINGKVKRVYHWIENNSYIKYINSVKELESAINCLDLEKEYNYVEPTLEKEFASLLRKLKDGVL